MALDDLLRTTVEMGGSDLHLKVGAPPLVRVLGDLVPLDAEPLSQDEARHLSYTDLTPEQQTRFERDLELDFAYAIPDLARFRGNLYRQRGMTQSAFRVIPLAIRTLEELRLPPVCKYFAERPRGLVLVTGAAGSGKSSTLAALIDYINKHFTVHVITIEDPIEFVHEDDLALINQREINRDTHSFSHAMAAALRQDPNVIQVGELRDAETISLALAAAETGHLVLGALHTPDPVQGIERLIDLFPPHRQAQVRMQLSVNLVGVVSQTLVKTAAGQSQVAAFETLVGVSAVRSLIREGKTHQILPLIQTGGKQGMMTRDQSLAQLVKRGTVSYEEALEHAHNPTELDFLSNDGSPDPEAAANGAPADGSKPPFKPSIRLGRSS